MNTGHILTAMSYRHWMGLRAISILIVLGVACGLWKHRSRRAGCYDILLPERLFDHDASHGGEAAIWPDRYREVLSSPRISPVSAARGHFRHCIFAGDAWPAWTGAFRGRAFSHSSCTSRTTTASSYDPGNTTAAGTGILWSLAVEEHFYMIYPAVCEACWHWGYRSGVSSWFSQWRASPCSPGGCISPVFRLPYLRGRTTVSDTRVNSIVFGCLLALAANPKS